MSEVLLRTTGVKGGREGCWFLDIPDLRICSKDILFLIGPNGSGKSTLLETLFGALPTGEGQIERLAPVSYLPSSPRSQEGVTGETLYDILGVHHSEFRDPKVTASLDAQDLLARPLELLSAGERQRVFLSAILQHSGRVVILDEPLSHLDWRYQLATMRLLEQQSASGRAFVVALHELTWIPAEAEVLALHLGKVVARGRSEEVLTSRAVQDCFYFHSAFVQNPIDGQRQLLISKIGRNDRTS